MNDWGGLRRSILLLKMPISSRRLGLHLARHFGACVHSTASVNINGVVIGELCVTFWTVVYSIIEGKYMNYG